MSRRSGYGSGGRQHGQQAGTGQSLKMGALYGAVAWVAGYVLSWLLFTTDSVLSDGEFGDGDPSR